MKRIALIPAFIALAGLSACGLRGELERPDPLWGEPEATIQEEASAEPELRPRNEEPQRLAGTSYVDPETGRTIWVENEGGGYAPLASPTTTIQEEELPPLAE
ncbi:hypothetical protein [Ponticaulis sp.]|uniref:hypothetical protein n=1 Tax=Ponticaulis sp. TaxID=2020902 RepID=UPI0025ED7BB0|nr:hypothetical protein [Ponticaulis sp.]|tara:strand:+ start:72 stop:380 length:309 start_codon:yes stop_codon:yes gene_type:complete